MRLGHLTEESTIFFHRWLAENGYTFYAELAAGQQRERETEARCVGEIPSSLRPLWVKRVSVGALTKRMVLAIELPFETSRVRALLGWIGCARRPWFEHGLFGYERDAERLLEAYSTDEVVSALDGRRLTEVQAEGAAWYFAFRSSAKLPGDLRRQLREQGLTRSHESNRELAKGLFGDGGSQSGK
jgi:hypothetical protein